MTKISLVAENKFRKVLATKQRFWFPIWLLKLWCQNLFSRYFIWQPSNGYNNQILVAKYLIYYWSKIVFNKWHEIIFYFIWICKSKFVTKLKSIAKILQKEDVIFESALAAKFVFDNYYISNLSCMIVNSQFNRLVTKR